MEESLLNSKINLSTLIDALINSDGSLSYKIEEHENTIKFQTDEKTAKTLNTLLHETLTSRANFHKTRLYTIQNPSPKDSVEEELRHEDIPPPPSNHTVQHVKEIFFNLFDGKKIEAKTFVNISVLFTGNAEIENGIFHSTKTDITPVFKIWKNFINYLTQHFEQASLTDIRNAWSGKKHLQEPQETLITNVNKNKIFAEGLIQQCFGMMFHKNEQDLTKISEASIFFNYQRLYQLIFPPVIQLQQSQANNMLWELTINNSNHFFIYLEQLIRDGELLRIYRTEEEIKAQLIIISNKPTITKPILHTLVIDCSGSMRSSFDPLKKHICTLLDKLYSLDSSADVAIIFFSNNIEKKFFNLSQLEDIKLYIGNKIADGGTKLYEAIGKELEDTIKKRITYIYNNNMIFLTDGHDTYKGDRNKIGEQFKLFDNKKLPPPKCFSMGFGKDYDQKLLTEIANFTGGERHDLQNPEDFDVIYTHLTKLMNERKLLEIITHLHNEHFRKFILPIFNAQNITVPNFTLPFTTKEPLVFSINDHEVKIQIPTNPELIPSANNTDLLREFLHKMHHIVHEFISPSKQRRDALEELKKATNQLSNLTEDEKIAQMFILDEITSLITNEAKKIQEIGFQKSISTLATYEKIGRKLPPLPQPDTSDDKPHYKPSIHQ